MQKNKHSKNLNLNRPQTSKTQTLKTLSVYLFRSVVLLIYTPWDKKKNKPKTIIGTDSSLSPTRNFQDGGRVTDFQLSSPLIVSQLLFSENRAQNGTLSL